MSNIITKAKKSVATATLLANLALTGLASTASAAEFQWRFANLYGRGSAFGEIYQSLAKDIEAKTNGEIKVQVLFSGEGVATSTLLSSAKSGLITMAAPFQSMHAGELPAGIVEIGLPGGTSDVEKLQKLFKEQGWAEILEKAYASQGLVWLEPYIQPPVYVITKKPINSIADFAGLKIRAPGAYGKFLRTLGASPVSMAWSEIYTSLATGVIDGSIGSNMIDHRDGNHVEVAKYMYKLPLAGAQVLPIVINHSAWEKLSDEQKNAVRSATENHAKLQLEKSQEWEAQALAEMQEKGLQWSPEPSAADRKAWQEAGSGLWDEYSTQDKYSEQMIDVLRENKEK